MDVITEFINGATVRITARVYDEDNALASPDSIVVNISKDDTVLVEDEAMEQVSTGIYEYYYNTENAGRYEGKVVVVDGAGAGARTSIGAFSFSVKGWH